MAEVFIGSVIETLGNELTSFIPKMWRWGSAAQEVKESCQVLSDLVTFLKDLKELKHTSYGLMSYYQDLKYLVEDLEEVVADLKEDMEQQPGILRRIKKVLKPDSTLKDELKAITTRIRNMYDVKNIMEKEFITKPVPTPAYPKMFERESLKKVPIPADPKMFGRESEKEAIFELLKTPSSYGECVYDFISIVGMGGIGKTTLAKHVYQEGSAASFPVRAWCHVSMVLNHCEIYRSIIEQQWRSQCLIKDSFTLEEELRKELMGKKFLIVLDDYWSESLNDFNALRAPFMAAEPGSKFIVTTRKRAVAKRFTAEESIIDLGLLSKEDCWSLFCSGSSLAANSTSNLVTIAKEICEKCDGLPLSVAVIKGFVAGIDDEAGWRVVLDDMVSGKISDVRSIIKRSYWDLPEHLKSCFSFCTIFPQGHSFERQSTVDLWICAEISRGEDEGGRWFEEIVSRSLLTLNPCGYMMHDIIRGSGMEVTGETFSRWEEKVGSWEMIRHVSISKEMTAKALDNLNCISKEMVHVRTLYIDCENYENDDMDALFTKWKHLRVLQMQNLKLSKLSNYISKMKHLRKLELRNIDDLENMSVISNLDNLMEVDIADCNSLVGPIPSTLQKLVRLKRFSIENCQRLTGPIPSELGDLIELKHFSLIGCKALKGMIPTELGNFTNLISFSLSGCRDLTGTIPTELGGLTNLKIFSLEGCQGLTGNIPLELECLIRLTNLNFSGCEGLTGEIPLELGCLTNLTNLTFAGCRGLTGRIPRELGGLTNLLFFSLSECGGLRGTIPLELGGLTRLLFFSLNECGGLTGTIPKLGDLTKLRFISLSKCRGLTGMIPTELGGLKDLRFLYMDGCEGLTGTIPPELGSLKSLFELSISGCKGLTGTIPPELGDLEMVIELSISGCKGLIGTIPQELGKLTRLRTLSFSGCNGLIGPTPMELRGLPALKHFSLDNCSDMIGPI